MDLQEFIYTLAYPVCPAIDRIGKLLQHFYVFGHRSIFGRACS